MRACEEYANDLNIIRLEVALPLSPLSPARLDPFGPRLRLNWIHNCTLAIAQALKSVLANWIQIYQMRSRNENLGKIHQMRSTGGLSIAVRFTKLTLFILELIADFKFSPFDSKSGSARAIQFNCCGFRSLHLQHKYDGYVHMMNAEITLRRRQPEEWVGWGAASLKPS